MNYRLLTIFRKKCLKAFGVFIKCELSEALDGFIENELYYVWFIKHESFKTLDRFIKKGIYNISSNFIKGELYSIYVHRR